jgi:uncharacterized protein (DUF1015 family)
MIIVSTQKYRNPEIIEAKKKELTGKSFITLPVYAIGNTGFYALADGHHRYEAAKQLGIEIKYKILNKNDLAYGDYGQFHYDLETGKCYMF